jgi:copper chaperone CopZ
MQNITPCSRFRGANTLATSAWQCGATTAALTAAQMLQIVLPVAGWRLVYSHSCTQSASHALSSAVPCAGVENVDIDLPSKKVTVRGNVTPEAVKEKVGSQNSLSSSQHCNGSSACCMCSAEGHTGCRHSSLP